MYIFRQAGHLLFCILIILIKTAPYVLHIIYRNILRNEREKNEKSPGNLYPALYWFWAESGEE